MRQVVKLNLSVITYLNDTPLKSLNKICYVKLTRYLWEAKVTSSRKLDLATGKIAIGAS